MEEHKYDVVRYGAKGDGICHDTSAIQSAVNAASSAGGGVVYFPAGTYLSGTVRLKSNITLHLDNGAVLLASPDIEDYNPKNFLYAKNASNIVLQGFGKIDGNGHKFYERFKPYQHVQRALRPPINLITSFMFWQFIWKMNPIPSAAYPYAQKLWPFRATMQLLWTTATSEGETWLLQALKAKYILWGFAGCLGLYGITKATRVPELVFYGVISGFGKLPDGLIPQFIGACINRFYLSKVFKPDIWRRYAMVLIAGYYAGMGLVGMASISFVFIAKAIPHCGYPCAISRL